MKRNFNLLLMAFAVFGLLSACEDMPMEDEKTDDTEQNQGGTGNEDGKEEGDGKEDEGGNENEGGNEGGSGVGDLPTFTFPYFDEYPLEPGNLYAEGSDVGVTIEVKRVEDQNFVFELRPGAMVQSFKFDVYPLAQLYNYLLHDRNAGVLTGVDAIDMAEHIRTYIFNTEGSGGYEISIEDFDNPEDFLQIEYDWMNTPYAAASAIAIPDCDYIIAVVGGTDTTVNSSNQEELTLCYVHTTSQPLIGDPQVEIEVKTGYTEFAVQHYPNADAAGIYFFGGLTAEIDEYIGEFGDIMFRDFMRTGVTAPSVYDPSVEGSCFYRISYGLDADPTIKSTTCAVAVDANLTPAEEYSRSDFHLEERPEETPEAFAEMDVIEERVGAAYFEFDIKFSETCRTVLYRLYTKEQKEAFEAATEADRRKELIDMLGRNGSMGCHNPNFPATAETGTSAVVREQMLGLEEIVPGTDIYIGYFCRNAYMEYSDMMFSDVASLDERNFTSSADCKVKDLELKVSNPGRQKFTVDITYDPETVSLVYVQAILPEYVPSTIPTVDSPWTDWIDFIMNWQSDDYTSEEFCANIMCWYTLPSGHDNWTFTGMVPGMNYLVFCCAEDFDGNLSDVKLATIKTNDIQVGPDPTMKLSLSQYKGTSYDWTVRYEIDHDVEYFLYCYTMEASDLAPHIPGLNQGHLNNIAESGISYETWRDGIYNWVAGGFENNGGGMRADSDTSQDWKGDQTVIAACIAVGKNEDGNPVYKMYHLICKDGKAQTLEEIFGMTE